MVFILAFFGTSFALGSVVNQDFQTDANLVFYQCQATGGARGPSKLNFLEFTPFDNHIMTYMSFDGPAFPILEGDQLGEDFVQFTENLVAVAMRVGKTSKHYKQTLETISLRKDPLLRKVIEGYSFDQSLMMSDPMPDISKGTVSFRVRNFANDIGGQLPNDPTTPSALESAFQLPSSHAILISFPKGPFERKEVQIQGEIRLYYRIMSEDSPSEQARFGITRNFYPITCERMSGSGTRKLKEGTISEEQRVGVYQQGPSGKLDDAPSNGDNIIELPFPYQSVIQMAMQLTVNDFSEIRWKVAAAAVAVGISQGLMTWFGKNPAATASSFGSLPALGFLKLPSHKTFHRADLIQAHQEILLAGNNFKILSEMEKSKPGILDYYATVAEVLVSEKRFINNEPLTQCHPEDPSCS